LNGYYMDTTKEGEYKSYMLGHQETSMFVEGTIIVYPRFIERLVKLYDIVGYDAVRILAAEARLRQIPLDMKNVSHISAILTPAQDRALVLTSNGVIPDSFSQGDFPTMIWANLRALFGLSQSEEDSGRILHYILAPGHEYQWQYPEVYSQVKNFLTKNFGTKW